MGKKKKIRADFRKNRTPRARQSDWTQRFEANEETLADAPATERLSGKGDLTRKRTVMGVEAEGDTPLQLDVGAANQVSGTVLSVYGLNSEVQTADGVLSCTTRRLLRTMSTDQRHVVAAGDRVVVRRAEDGTGVIERVEPRHGVLSRASRGRQHIIVTNVDQILIVGSAAEPYLKPNLIDRLLVTAEQRGIRPVIAINKIDLVDPAGLAPLVGVYSQIGYRVHLLSARTGFGVARLRRELQGRTTAVAGQSGVGKSSLLNGIEPDLALRVREVSEATEKGKHTTTTARLAPLSGGGFVVDTPGIRQFQLWDVVPQEIAGWFRDLRPFVNHCRYPDCSHTHETHCAVKDAVADDLLDVRRYESYCHMLEDDPAVAEW